MSADALQELQLKQIDMFEMTMHQLTMVRRIVVLAVCCPW